MDLTLDKKHENKITFLAEGVSISMANSIRRYAMMHIPVLAIDKVTFYDNNSAMFDEYIAHRMGLMPVATPAKTPKEAAISFRLDESGPKTVYSQDLKSSDKEIAVAREKLPIITLGENQRIRLEAATRLGSGTEHAKFQAGIVSYGLEDDKIRFQVESFYQMTPAEMIRRGCSALEEDLEEYAKLIKKLEKPSKKKKKE